MSTTALVKPLSKLFGSSAFIVPDYQRTYAWETRKTIDSRDHQIDDFWDDLYQAFVNYKSLKSTGKSPQEYYWGTLTLNKTLIQRQHNYINYQEYSIVDGQQRTITMMLLLSVIDRKLNHIIASLLMIGTEPRLKVGSLNKNTFLDLLNSSLTSPIRDLHLKTNQRLLDAITFFDQKVGSMLSSDLKELLDYFLNTTIALEFDAGDDRLATQAFLSLNDRGKPLTVLEKMKGFLSNYDSNYLGSSLTSSINHAFSKVYTNLDQLNAVGDQENLPYFRSFSDNDFLRLVYHYSAKNLIGKYTNCLCHNSRATSSESLEFFRDTARLLIPSSNLRQMICDILCNMELVSDALDSIANQAKSSIRPDLLKLFRFLEINPNLIICLVGAQINSHLSQDLVSELENVDVRVFKVLGLNRIKPLHDAVLTKLRDRCNSHIISGLQGYRRWFAPDHNFRARIANLYGIAKDNYILWEYQKYIDPSFNDLDTSLFDSVTVEHIFAQTPCITLPGCGFSDENDYSVSLHVAGNLSLLEKNSAASNLPPASKAIHHAYKTSLIPDIKQLCKKISSLGSFEKKDILDRTNDFLAFSIKRWPT